MRPLRLISTLVVLLVLLGAVPRSAGARNAGMEFVGPFQTWRDAKEDYGAVGDGQADDTAALQKALDELRPPDGHRVLYLPAGVYRITRTLKVLRDEHAESQGISILGEDPARTVLLWKGPEDGVMMHYGAWYSRMSRLTFHGAQKASVALRHGKKFATANEFSDCVFRDVEVGIKAGMREGIAETAVLRCRFVRCSEAGISIQNFNSLDWWIWDCLFDRCGIGVTNERGGGHFHVYGSAFLRSQVADMSIRHCSYFGIRRNTSFCSKAFFLARRAENWTMAEHWGAQITLQDNTVLDCGEATPVQIENAGNVLLLDNSFRHRAGGPQGPFVRMNPPGGGDMVSVGNVFTRKDPLEVEGRLRTMGDRVVDSVDLHSPRRLSFSSHAERNVTEVPAYADTAAIQRAINAAAAREEAKRPVVHLMGREYRIERTLVVPALSDVQIVGDGLLNATRLVWAGKPKEGPMLLLRGPSHATLRHFSLDGGGTATGIRAIRCDQKDGRVLMEQVQVAGKGTGFFCDRLDRTRVRMRSVGHSGCEVGVKVEGGPSALLEEKTEGATLMFGGASSNNRISYELDGPAGLLVSDVWYESNAHSRFLRFSGAGRFTLHGATVAVAGGEDVPAMLFDGFNGRASVIGASVHSVGKTAGPAALMLGDDPRMKVLFLGCLLGRGNDLVNEAEEGMVGMLNNRAFAAEAGTRALPDAGTLSDEFLGKMLEQTRGEKPLPVPRAYSEKATDLRLYRLHVSNCSTCIHLRRD